MEGMVEIVNGKPRRIVERHGKRYIRIGVEIEVNTYARAEQKVQFFGRNMTDLIRESIAGFVNNFGIIDKNREIKDPGDLFDPRFSRHIQEAARRATEDISQCQIHTN